MEDVLVGLIYFELLYLEKYYKFNNIIIKNGGEDWQMIKLIDRKNNWMGKLENVLRGT